MKKITVLFLSLAFISTILFFFVVNQSVDNDTTKVENRAEFITKEENNVKLKLDDEIKEISFSKSNENVKTVFDGAEAIETINNIFASAVKVNGIVDMRNTDFLMDIFYIDGNKQSFHLWLGKKGETSAIMNTEDTNTIYTVSEDMTDKLLFNN